MAKRIVSLACTHTELLHFLGAGKRIVAVDQFSDFPAKLVSKIGCTIDPWLSDPAKVLEDIDKLEPDLVLLSYPFQKEFFEANKLKNGVEVQLLEAPVGDNWLEDMFAQYRQLGSLAGEEDQAERIIGEMGRDFDAIRLHISRQDENWRAFTREDNSETPTFLLETDSDFYSASRATHLSKVLEDVCMLRNIVESDALYPQLSHDDAIALDPDLWFTVHKDDSTFAETYPEMVPQLAALQRGNLHQLNADAANRYTPRLVDYARHCAEIVLTRQIGLKVNIKLQESSYSKGISR